MGQIVGSNISATAAMFALWIGVLGILAVFPYCIGSAEINARQNYGNTQVELVLPS